MWETVQAKAGLGELATKKPVGWGRRESVREREKRWKGGMGRNQEPGVGLDPSPQDPGDPSQQGSIPICILVR